VAPLFGLQVLERGATEVRRAWGNLGRAGQARIVTGRYFSLGKCADSAADTYIRHYYRDAFFPAARADTLTSLERLARELERLDGAGVTDLVLYPF
jgi:hypothetical protein